jgi:hypothetical protein
MFSKFPVNSQFFNAEAVHVEKAWAIGRHYVEHSASRCGFFVSFCILNQCLLPVTRELSSQLQIEISVTGDGSSVLHRVQR